MARPSPEVLDLIFERLRALDGKKPPRQTVEDEIFKRIRKLEREVVSLKLKIVGAAGAVGLIVSILQKHFGDKI